MAQSTFIPKTVPYCMREEGYTRPAKYNRGHMETAWQSELIMAHEDEDAVYLQKVQRADPFRFFYDSTDTSSRRLDIIDCDGVVVLADIAQSATADITGNLDDDGDQYHSYRYNLPDLSAITADGQYYLLLTVTYDLLNQTKYISHPLHIRDLHEDTMLLEASNSVNKKRTWYEQLPVTVRIRVDAFFGPPVAKNVSTGYAGQSQSWNVLDRTAYNEYPLYVGERDPIPAWMYDKLNHILDLDTVRFDGKLMEPGPNASLDRDGDGPLFPASITMQEPTVPVGLETNKKAILLYLSPLTYNSGGIHYASAGIYLGPNNGVRIGGPAVIDDTTEEDAYIDSLNTAIANTEFTGEVVNTAGFVQYVLGDGETAGPAAAIIYPLLAIGLHVTAGGALVNPTASFTMEKGHFVVDWGHGAAINADAGNLPITFSHVYPTLTAATYTVRIFGNSARVFSMDAGAVLTMDSLSGSFTPDLAKLTLARFGFASNQLDFGIFANSPVMEELNVLNSGLTSINNLSFVSGSSAANPQASLRTINLSGNAFTNSAALNILRQVLANVTNNNVIGGTLSIVQTPILSLGFSGGVLISGLGAKSWLVNL